MAEDHPISQQSPDTDSGGPQYTDQPQHADKLESATATPDSGQIAQSDSNAASLPLEPEQIFQRQTPQGLSVFLGSETDGVPVSRLLNSMAQKQSLYWLINAKAAGIPSGDILPEDGNLLAELGAEIGSNSMHVVPYRPATDESADELKQIVNVAISNNSAVCVGSGLEHPDLVEAIKPVIAWFISVPNLKFQLDNGKGHLIEQLFASLSFIQIFDLQSATWIVFNGGTPLLDWEELGLPVQPTL